MPRKTRPHLRLEMGGLGRVDPFQLSVEERPPGSGRFRVRGGGSGEGLSVERAGLCLVGASQALFQLSFRWLQEVDGFQPETGGTGPQQPPPVGDLRLTVQRREARLLGSLLRRHIGRLPEPPEWMSELLQALEEMDEFLRWQD